MAGSKLHGEGRARSLGRYSVQRPAAERRRRILPPELIILVAGRMRDRRMKKPTHTEIEKDGHREETSAATRQPDYQPARACRA